MDKGARCGCCKNNSGNKNLSLKWLSLKLTFYGSSTETEKMVLSQYINLRFGMAQW